MRRKFLFCDCFNGDFIASYVEDSAQIGQELLYLQFGRVVFLDHIWEKSGQALMVYCCNSPDEVDKSAPVDLKSRVCCGGGRSDGSLLDTQGQMH